MEAAQHLSRVLKSGDWDSQLESVVAWGDQCRIARWFTATDSHVPCALTPISAESRARLLSAIPPRPQNVMQRCGAATKKGLRRESQALVLSVVELEGIEPTAS